MQTKACLGFGSPWAKPDWFCWLFWSVNSSKHFHAVDHGFYFSAFRGVVQVHRVTSKGLSLCIFVMSLTFVKAIHRAMNFTLAIPSLQSSGPNQLLGTNHIGQKSLCLSLWCTFQCGTESQSATPIIHYIVNAENIQFGTSAGKPDSVKVDPFTGAFLGLYMFLVHASHSW